MSIIERADLRAMLAEQRLLRQAMLENGNLGKAHLLARSIRRIKRAIAQDRYSGSQYLRDESRMVLGV